MPDNINYNHKTGKHAFMSVRERAWHGLGQVVDRYLTSAEAIQVAGLDYIVEKRPMIVKDDVFLFNSTVNQDCLVDIIDIPNYYATIRTDTKQVLGVVSNDYEIVQNRDAFNFFDAIVGGGDGIMYETAGALGNGERIFITAKLPGYIRVGNDDLIEKYLFLTTSHDGFGSITIAFTPIRIVCNNTLNAALRNMSNCYKIRHTESAKERLEEAHKVMGLSNTLADQLGDVFNRWSKTIIRDKEVVKLVQMAMAPSKEVLNKVLTGEAPDEFSSRFKNTVERICDYAFFNPTQQMDTTRGTLFGAYNAITGYFQNVLDYKNDEQKLKSVMFGNGLTKSQTAFNICQDFEKFGSDSFILN